MAAKGQFLILLAIGAMCIFLLLQMKPEINQKKVSAKVRSMYDEWHECIMKNITIYRDDHNGFWGHLWKGVQLCEKLPRMAALPIADFHNSDETKRSIIPKIKEPSVIVTLGIGHDTAAEEAIKMLLPEGSMFYGADPIQEINEKLYTKFGLYFPFAIGGHAGMSTADVLINNSYVKRTVVHVDMIYFLLNIVKRTFYDDIWFDAEGAEYDLFPFFHNGGEFDRNHITLCQFNMEVHLPNEDQKKLFHKFMWKILADRRYAFYRPVQGNHIRLFFLNFDNERCAQKYIGF